jgi:hypothetical protein
MAAPAAGMKWSMRRRTEQSRKLGPLAKRHLHVVSDLGSLAPEHHAIRAMPARALPMTPPEPHSSPPRGGVVG